MTKTVKKGVSLLLAALIMLSGLSLVSFAQTVTQDKGVIIEAEDATYLGDTAFSDIHKGYSGRGFVAIPFSNESGVEFTVESDFEGSVILTIGYANHQLAAQRMNLSVNGELLKYSYAPVTGAWTNYDEYHEIIPLVKGTNTIRYFVGTDENSGFNVDYFIVGNERIDKSQLEVDVPEPSAEPEKPEQKEPLSSGKSIRYEAEFAALSGGAACNAEHLGYSGTGFVAGTATGAAITYTISSDVAGLFMMNIGYANFHGVTVNMSLYINGEKVKQLAFPNTGAWANYRTITEQVELSEGENQIVIKTDPEDRGNINIDYIDLKLEEKYAGTPLENTASSLGLLPALGICDEAMLGQEQNMTRAEFSMLLAGALGFHEQALLAVNPKALFADLPKEHAAGRAITYLYEQKIISKAELFRPEDEIKLEEMVKMVCEALGYGPFAAQRGGYPNGYLQQAAQNKLLTGVSLKAGDHVPTQAALALIYNALFADMGVFVSEGTGQYVDFSGMTLLKYVFEVEKVSGIVTSDDSISLWGEPQAETGKLLIGEKAYRAGNVQSGEFLGYAVDAYIANDDETILMLHKTDKNSVLVIPGTDVTDLLESGVKYAADGEDNKEKTAKINRETALFYNRTKIDAKSLAALGVENGRITLVDNNSDGVYDVLLAESFVSEQVASVDSMDKTIYLKSGKKLEITENVQMNVKFSSIKENDVASCGYSVSGELQIVRITRKTTTGKITALKNGSVVLDGTEYECTPDAKQGMKLGISITAYQDQDGTILFWEKQSSSQSGESYGVILDAAMESKAIDGSSLLLKIWTSQNTQQIFNITQSITVNGKKMDVTKDLLSLFVSAKEQLVRYSAKEDTLRSITLARAGSDFEELTGGFTNYRYKVQQRGFEIPGIYASNFMLRDDTAVFSLVKENNVFSDKKSQVTTSAYFAHDQYYTIRAYDKDEQGRCKAIVVMSSASDTFKPASEMFLCTDVFTGLNEKDEIVTFVKGYFRGEEREMAVWEGFATPFEVGGVYIVTTRENKEIGIAQLVDSVYNSADLSLSSLGGVRVACLGTVTGAGGGVCEVTANGQANSFVVSTANVYRVNAETKKASLATPDSITKGSRVFINQDDFYVRDVFIIE